MNSRTRETVVGMLALRIMVDGWKADAECPDIYDSRLDQYCRDDAKTLGDAVEIALYRHEQQAREEVRLELGEEVEGVGTLHSTTLREAQGVDDEECPDCGGTGDLGTAPDGRLIACETCGGHEDSLGSGKLLNEQAEVDALSDQLATNDKVLREAAGGGEGCWNWTDNSGRTCLTMGTEPLCESCAKKSKTLRASTNDGRVPSGGNVIGEPRHEHFRMSSAEIAAAHDPSLRKPASEADCDPETGDEYGGLEPMSAYDKELHKRHLDSIEGSVEELRSLQIHMTSDMAETLGKLDEAMNELTGWAKDHEREENLDPYQEPSLPAEERQ